MAQSAQHHSGWQDPANLPAPRKSVLRTQNVRVGEPSPSQGRPGGGEFREGTGRASRKHETRPWKRQLRYPAQEGKRQRWARPQRWLRLDGGELAMWLNGHYSSGGQGLEAHWPSRHKRGQHGSAWNSTWRCARRWLRESPRRGCREQSRQERLSSMEASARSSRRRRRRRRRRRAAPGRAASLVCRCGAMERASPAQRSVAGDGDARGRGERRIRASVLRRNCRRRARQGGRVADRACARRGGRTRPRRVAAAVCGLAHHGKHGRVLDDFHARLQHQLLQRARLDACDLHSRHCGVKGRRLGPHVEHVSICGASGPGGARGRASGRG